MISLETVFETGHQDVTSNGFEKFKESALQSQAA